MGIKENFTQAVKELTGIGKEKTAAERSNAPGSIEELKRAVEDDASFKPREITLDSSARDSGAQVSVDIPGVDEFDLDSMSSSVRPMTQSGTADSPSVQQIKPESSKTEPESTPAAEAFLSGGEVPVSLFGRQQSSQPQTAREVVPERTVHSDRFTQPMQASPFSQNPASPFSQNQYSQNPGYGGYSGYTGGEQSYHKPMSPVPVHASRHTRDNEDNELTVISRNTIIDGNIRSFANMSIDGDIKGDVETTKDIDLNGKIIGNITCNNAMMHTSQVQGNVRMKGNISMKRDTLLMGDLMSTYAEVNGKVKGNLDVVGKADLKGDAVVFGDISASTITVEDGAIIQGYVSTTFLNKEESKNLFPETVVIGDAGATRA